MSPSDPMKVDVPDIRQLFSVDPYLRMFEWEIRRRLVSVDFLCENVTIEK